MRKNKVLIQTKEDIKKSNPGLHYLYVVWAIKHLLSLRKCISELDSHSNTNMLNSVCALIDEYKKLLATNLAYKEAEEILVENKDSLLENIRETPC